MAYTTFDPATITDVTLSGGDLTVTHANANPYAGVRSAHQQSSGKYYYEMTLTVIVGNASCVGVLTPAGTYQNFLSDGTKCAALFNTYGAGGEIWSNDGYSGKNLGASANGDVIGIAIDLDNETAWFINLTQATDWNGDGAADPATNTGGVSISAYTATTMSPAVAFNGDATENFTANFGDSGFAGSVPSGFTSGWSDAVPPTPPESSGGAAALLSGL